LAVRVVALGASNLTRGLQSVVAAARDEFGPDVDVVAALGHGRSYGADSWFVGRRLPGILQCGLWRALDEWPPAPTRAVVSDVGNDILYGFAPSQILAWVREAVDRLQRHTSDITLAGLPSAGISRISPLKFAIMRTILFPPCRLSLADVSERAASVEDGLRALAAARGLRFVAMDADWYGFDPIHIRPSLWQDVWREMLAVGPRPARPAHPHLEGLRLYRLRPERRWVFGIEQVTPQHGHALPRGGRVWLF
jgi:hypothetical protein